MRRLLRDESGVAMGLAVILVVIIGVMGAGLLVFVHNDLEAVVEVNQGQRAFEMADAGVQAAEQQLDEDRSAESYDDDNTDESNWSHGNDNNADQCKDLGPDGDPNGVCLTNLYGADADDAVNVQIKYCEDESEEGCEGEGDFKVVSTGKYGDARRRVEAEFKKTGGGSGEEGELPQMVYAAKGTSTDKFSLEGMGMYSEGSIEIKNYLALRDASMFSGGDIIAQFQNDNTYDISGTDPYGDWADGTYNETARSTTASGMGAVGDIEDKNNSDVKPEGWGTQFFDSDTGEFSGSDPQADFVEDPGGTQSEDEITFPFDGRPDIDSLSDTLEEAAKNQEKQYTVVGGGDRIDTSESQGNYIKIESTGGTKSVTMCDASGGSGGGCDQGDVRIKWPTVDESTPASEWPVVYVEFSNRGNNNVVKWRVKRDPQPQFSGSNPSERCESAREGILRRGVLLVENGSVEAVGRTAPLDGGIITQGNPSDRRDIGGDAPDLCVKGPVIASGGIEREGRNTSFGALDDEEADGLPGFSGGGGPTRVSLQSWREVYE